MEHKELVALLGTLPVKANTLTALEETLDHMLTTNQGASWLDTHVGPVQHVKYA